MIQPAALGECRRLMRARSVIISSMRSLVGRPRAHDVRMGVTIQQNVVSELSERVVVAW